jgi:RNA polymerase sigma factor (TIGR02999 family)
MESSCRSGKLNCNAFARGHSQTVTDSGSNPSDPHFDSGAQREAERLLAQVYDELRKVAQAKLARESADLTLQATALVHEAWLRVGGDEQPRWANRAHFFSAAAEAMRRILIERARRRMAIRHGGDQQRVEFDEIEGLADSMNDDEHVIDLGEALGRFEAEHPRKAELVKLRYFVGLTIEEASNLLEISAPTAKRWWAYSKAWLYQEIKGA